MTKIYTANQINIARANKTTILTDYNKNDQIPQHVF